MKDNKKNERRQIDDMEVCAFKFEYPKRSPNLSEMVSLLKATQSRNENVYKFNFPRFKFQVKLKRKDKKKCMTQSHWWCNTVTKRRHWNRIYTYTSESSIADVTFFGSQKKKTNCISRSLHCMWNQRESVLADERSYRRKQCRHTRTTFAFSTQQCRTFFCASAACNVYNRMVMGELFIQYKLDQVTARLRVSIDCSWQVACNDGT